MFTAGRGRKTIHGDSVIASTGFKPGSDFYKEFREKITALDPELEIYAAGDCVKCEKIYNVINSGAHIAWQL